MPVTDSGPASERPPVVEPTSPSLACAIPLHSATDLTAGGSVAHIQLNGQVYEMRITKLGKLILTK